MPDEVHAARKRLAGVVEQARAGLEDLQDVIDLQADRPARDSRDAQSQQCRLEADDTGDLVELPGELGNRGSELVGRHASTRGFRPARA